MDWEEASIPNQRPVVQRGPPQRQLVHNTDNTNPPLVANQPVTDDPIPVRHFEPNPLLEVPQQDKEPQEVIKTRILPIVKSQCHTRSI